MGRDDVRDDQASGAPDDGQSDRAGVDLGTVAETLLIPLQARAKFTREGSRLISDPRAVEMVEAIDYDFEQFQGPSLFGSVVRTRMLDLWVQDWLEQHPAGTVVEIGAGLNTRYERLDNGTARWIDLDLPDAMSLRRQFFSDTPRRRTVAASVTEEGWLQEVDASPRPWFFVAEAVLCFLPEPEVAKALSAIVNRSATSIDTVGTEGNDRLAVDTWGTYRRDTDVDNDPLKVMDARVEWFADTAQDVEALAPGLEALESFSLSGCDRRLVDVMSSSEREIFDGAKDHPLSAAYKLNLFRLT